MRVTFQRSFSAAHRLWSDASKCQNIHGHNYRVTIEVTGPVGMESGMVTPFEWVKEIVDNYDHCLILHVQDPNLHELGHITRVVILDDLPTTENLAHQIAKEIADMLAVDGRERRVKVTLAETDNITATSRAEVSTERSFRAHDPGRGDDARHEDSLH
jgi:6-pyruvoyltetrahydropterin/6-carboxytetrahydropterin synthase